MFNNSHLQGYHRMVEASPLKSYGKPARKSYVDILDFLAALISISCLATSIVIVNPALPYAASLGTDQQIIALGFLLGIMNQCLQRIFPYLFILVEARYGSSSLQNYDGLLRWSPFASRLGIVWRVTLVILLITPLVLSVSYKQFIGGFSYTDVGVSNRFYAPTGPPGLQINIGRNTIMSNATSTFMSATTDDVDFPVDISSNSKVYGFNLILLSNTSAVAVDAPVPRRVAELQQHLSDGSSNYLSADIRGTVAQYNFVTGDEQYWNQTFDISKVDTLSLFDGFFFAVLQEGVATSDDPKFWNGSWTLVGTMSSGYVVDNSTQRGLNFLTTAMRFDVMRHACNATWKITRSSIELIAGNCDPEPLPPEYQYYDNCQLSLVDNLGRGLADNLGAFATNRNQSHWRVPTHAAIIASAYQSIVAAGQGYVPVQEDGPIWEYWNVTNSYNETYISQEHLQLETPTLRALGGLYFVLALQPVLTIVAFCGVIRLFHSPIARTFGLVSVMAGIERESLKLLLGAGFSGELKQSVGLEIKVSPKSPEAEDGGRVGKVKYRIGKSGMKGKVRHRRVYE
ncbi:hypothetical protein MMC18_003334 [Xylographa bjoerkii]|nr:hypothetical protein [Xylographa bjoerkii]